MVRDTFPTLMQYKTWNKQTFSFFWIVRAVWKSFGFAVHMWIDTNSMGMKIKWRKSMKQYRFYIGSNVRKTPVYSTNKNRKLSTVVNSERANCHEHGIKWRKIKPTENKINVPKWMFRLMLLMLICSSINT